VHRLVKILFFLISYGYGSAAVAVCVSVPANEPDAPVRVCEDGTTYRFEVMGDVRQYDKVEYRAALSDALHQWMDRAGVPTDARDDARVELWLSVPEANPDATQARAVVYGVPQPFVAYLSIDPSEWDLTDRDIGVLGDAHYPHSFGYRAGSLLVQARQVSSDPTSVVAPHGLTLTAAMGGGWYGYQLAPLAEADTRTAILGDTEAAPVVARVEVDTIFEWIAWRGQGFVFALSGD
jgi:hypothetical protein